MAANPPPPQSMPQGVAPPEPVKTQPEYDEYGMQKQTEVVPTFLMDPAKRFTVLGIIKVMAVMFIVITGVLNIVIMFMLTGSGSGNLYVGIAFTAMAIVFGALAVFLPMGKKVGGIEITTMFAIIAPVMMILGSGVGAMLLKVGDIQITDLFVALLFGLFLLLSIEYMSAVSRFYGIGKMAIERNLLNFDFNQVMRNYISSGFAMMVVILIISLVIVFARSILKLAMPVQFAVSVEMNSVYGLAISSAMIFTIIGIALTFMFGGRALAQDVRSVTAFSKEKLKEISATSQKTGTPLLATAQTVEIPQKK